MKAGAFALVLSLVVGAGARTSPAPIDRPEMARRIRAEMLHAWKAYETYAWGHDELKPVSGTAHDWYGAPLLMTPVDSLDTLILMGLTEEADKAKRLKAEQEARDVAERSARETAVLRDGQVCRGTEKRDVHCTGRSWRS